MDSNEVVNAFQNDSLGSDDAVGIANKIKKGELSASLVTQDAIAVSYTHLTLPTIYSV